jgi:hypothetical protein
MCTLALCLPLENIDETVSRIDLRVGQLFGARRARYLQLSQTVQLETTLCPVRQ